MVQLSRMIVTIVRAQLETLNALNANVVSKYKNTAEEHVQTFISFANLLHY